jgi:hypothetical protein
MNSSKIGMKAGAVTLSLAFALTSIVPAFAESLSLKKGTDVKLAFDSSLSSNTAKPGDHVLLHVTDPVQVDGKTVIAEGAKVRGTVKKVEKRKHFGVNANIQLLLDPVKTVAGTTAPLGFKSKSGDLSRPGTAAGTSVGAAAVLGPIGLAAGYFIVGKKVSVKPGDKLTADIDRDVTVNVK